jgi:hypothetical protein
MRHKENEMLKEFFNTLGVRQNSDKAHYDYSTQSRVIPSVFHTLILPLGLSIGSPVAGVIYFLFAVGAYFTIFRAKNYYVLAILKTIATAILAFIGWILLMGFVGAVGAVS